MLSGTLYYFISNEIKLQVINETHYKCENSANRIKHIFEKSILENVKKTDEFELSRNLH